MQLLKSALLVALLASGTAAVAGSPRVDARGEARLAKIVEGRVAGQPVDCIDLHRIDSTEVVDGTAIVYRDGSRLYVNRPQVGRESLNDDDVLLTKTYSPELCSIDTVRLLDRTSHFVRGFVGLGQFVPYTKPKQS